MFALDSAVKYIVRNDIEGDIVECGVWRGGSVMVCAMTLMLLGDKVRKIYLYDTFEGMTSPTEKGRDFRGELAANVLARYPAMRVESPEDEVRYNLSLTKFPDDRLVFIKGDVLTTIFHMIPEKIAVLRLDTDWYESTRHELIHLYPLVERLGVFLIDDYGYYEGAREAVDQYFLSSGPVLLNRIDYTGRIAVKA